MENMDMYKDQVKNGRISENKTIKTHTPRKNELSFINSDFDYNVMDENTPNHQIHQLP